MMLRSCVLLSLLAAVSGFCYFPRDDMDCLSTEYPYSGTPETPFPYLPLDTEVRYWLYTWNNLDNAQEIFYDNPSSIISSYFNPDKKTYLLIHGYTQDSQTQLLQELQQVLLYKEDCNVIMVDWSEAAWFPYPQAVQTARVIGRKNHLLISSIETLYGYAAARVTIIGHCLGAHIAGFTGHDHEGIGVIVGLDPAAPGFQNVDPRARLSKLCAKFVQCVHTDGRPIAQLGVGYIGQQCHLDVFMNGGSKMPECPVDLPKLISGQALCFTGTIAGPVKCPNPAPSPEECVLFTGLLPVTPKLMQSLEIFIYCDHSQSVRYYTQSISNQTFKGYPCETAEKCQQKVYQQCPMEGCPTLLHHAQPSTTGQYYVKTNRKLLPFIQDTVKQIPDVAEGILGLLPK